MKTLYPDALDFVTLSPSRNDKNDVDDGRKLTLDDLLYIIDELQKKVGVTNSTDTGSLDYRASRVRCGSITATAGTNTITFTALPDTNYFPQVELYNASGERLGAVPIFGTKTTTSIDVDCMDAGTLYYKLTPFIA